MKFWITKKAMSVRARVSTTSMIQRGGRRVTPAVCRGPLDRALGMLGACRRTGAIDGLDPVRPLRRPDLRLLRDADRLGGRHPRRACGRCSSRAASRAGDDDAARALRRARGRRSRPARTCATARSSRAAARGSPRARAWRRPPDELARVRRLGRSTGRRSPTRADGARRAQDAVRARASSPTATTTCSRHRTGGSASTSTGSSPPSRPALQAGPSQLRGRVRAHRRADASGSCTSPRACSTTTSRPRRWA